MSYGEQTRGKSVLPGGAWLFENLKGLQRKRFHQMNRYPFSKASCLAAGEGQGEREGWAAGGGGGVEEGYLGRGQTLLKLGRMNC